MIHNTFTRSACIHDTTGKCGFESHFLHLVSIEIYLIIFNSYDIIMTGYMHTMLDLCVLNDYVSFYKVIFIIYLPLKSLQSRSDSKPPTTQAAVHVQR